MIVLLNLVCKHPSKTINFVVYNNIPSVVYIFLAVLHWKKQVISDCLRGYLLLLKIPQERQ